MYYFLLSEDRMLFTGLSTLFPEYKAKYPLLLISSFRHIQNSSCVFYIIDSRMISKDVNHLLTKNTSVVILDFSGGYLPGNLDNIVRLDASEPPEFLITRLLREYRIYNQKTYIKNNSEIFLSPDEENVMTLFASGYSVIKTAEICRISIKKVYSMRRAIRLRLGFNNFNRLYLFMSPGNSSQMLHP